VDECEQPAARPATRANAVAMRSRQRAALDEVISDVL